jgi:hypothetical protein
MSRKYLFEKNPWYTEAYYWFLRTIWDNVKITDRHIKWFYQRRTRGFDDTELWSLDQPLAKHILPRLKAFRAYPLYGYPGMLDEPGMIEDDKNGENHDHNFKIWLAIIDKMIIAFEYILCDIDDDLDSGLGRSWIDDDCRWQVEKDEVKWKAYIEECKRRQEVINEGLRLFAKYFQSLWD